MAWSFVAVGTFGSHGTSTSFNLDLPAGAAEGDLLVAAIGFNIGSNPTVTWPSGWTEIASVFSGSRAIKMAYIRRGSSSPAVGVTVSTAPTVCGSHVVGYRPTTSPIYDDADAYAGTSATFGGTALTLAKSGALLVCAATSRGGFASSAFDNETVATTASSGSADTSTAPKSGEWLLRVANDTGNTGPDVMVSFGDAVATASGDSGRFTVTGATNVYLAYAAFYESSGRAYGFII